MAEHRVLPEGQDGCEPLPALGHSGMTDCVYASVQGMQLAPPHPVSNGSLTQPHLTQLIDGDHPVLSAREPRDRSLPTPSPSPSVTFRAHWSPKVAFGVGAPPALG